ncbi:MAG: redoxin domain-containing protein [Bacteroidales bacterium]|nr:redoxin domain-containing protein [Bacteroidales bacterium]
MKTNITTKRMSLGDELLDYPLVNLEGDTTSIREQEGWVLLNFWTTGCEPCIKNLMKRSAEKDSLGYIILENEGVRILAIEHKSNNMEIIAKRAYKTKSEDIMYSGKGIGSIINIPALGYYYLVSPNKEIVYETGDLGDYEEILKIIRN